jgi:hypothetical protein
MSTIQFNTQEQHLASVISDAIMEIEQLQNHCHLVAKAHSGITNEEFDENIKQQGFRVVELLATGEGEIPFEESTKYKLYWSIYNTTMQRITMLATASWFNPEITT